MKKEYPMILEEFEIKKGSGKIYDDKVVKICFAASRYILDLITILCDAVPARTQLLSVLFCSIVI